ncbi:BURP domain-containing protein 3 [Dendrobium catenatum]|uniref:BURP domain-containing protein 3 n=1 Tax=Dendrobium catenatum TaxID=906689 RepID=A0A2I0VYF7_9ASPA|nr:BURP domain-containing protein 3 [Dendrobium catenatum]
MDFLLFAIFIFMLTSSHAAVRESTSAQTYWQTILPQTPIPASIQELLRSEKEVKSFELERTPTFFVSYKCATNEKTIHNDPNAPLFFLKDSLNLGTKMTLDLTKSISAPPFLSVEMANATPFSSTKVTEILSLFSIKHGSAEDIAIQRTLAECEELPLDGERKSCVRSMEAMVDFVEAELGNRDVQVFETAMADVGDPVVAEQEYMIGQKEVKHIEAKALVSCHPEPYPRAVYYCHTAKNIEAYAVHLYGANGAAVDAVATCHTDTSAWDPNYVGFKMLKVKPRTEPICHFLPQGHLIFAGLSKMDISAF